MTKPILLTKEQRAALEKRRRQTHDKRIYARVSAVLWVAQGRSRNDVAQLLGVSLRQLGQWLRLYRSQGLEGLCALHHKGDPGNLTPSQIDQLKSEVGQGRFRNANQVRQWLKDTFGVDYSSSGVKALLQRLGVTYHKVSSFLWKADPDEQKQFVRKVRRHRREAKRPGSPKTRRYYVAASHPVWGINLVYSCWLLRGQRLLVGMGSGRQRLNILGAYCPDDHEYLDLRLKRDNINGEQVVNLLRLLRASHPETEQFILYVDNAKYYDKPVVQEWLARHPQFRLVSIPKYSPNCNLIERLWKFLKQKALSRWHKTFADMEAAIADVLDHLDRYHDELATLMTETFHIIDKQEIPVPYREVG